MKKIVRFEPLTNSCLLFEDGKMYSINESDLKRVLDKDDFILIRNSNNPKNILSIPIKVQIQVTEFCNLRCVTCAVPFKTVGSYRLSDDDLIEILDKLKEYGVLNIEWSGGEPLVRKNFISIVEYAYKNGFYQNILTNGLLFNNSLAKTANKYFYKMQISLDGVGEVYNNIVRVNGWDNFIESLKSLKKYCHNKLSIATVLQTGNVDHMMSILDFCIKYRIKKWRISMQVPMGRSSDVKWDSYSKLIDNFREQWPKIKRKAEMNSIKINSFLEKTYCFDDTISDVGYIVFPGAYSFLYINSSGNIYPFPFLSSKEFFLGNIKIDDLRDIWFNSKILKKLRKQTYKNTGCGNCRLECAFAERSLVYGFTKKIEGYALPHKECKKSIINNK